MLLIVDCHIRNRALIQMFTKRKFSIIKLKSNTRHRMVQTNQCQSLQNILAAIILVNLKPLLLQVTDLVEHWRESKSDFVSYLSTVHILCTLIS